MKPSMAYEGSKLLPVFLMLAAVGLGGAHGLGPRPSEASHDPFAVEDGVGVMGLSAIRLCDGAQIGMLSSARFPMAGVSNLPIAAAVLAQVDAGRLRLSDMVAVPEDQIVPSNGVLDKFAFPGVSLSIANLMDLALTRSDNTASDVLIRLAGGPAAISAWLSGHGFGDMRVDRTSADQMRQFFALGSGPIRATFAQAQASGQIDRRIALPNPDYENDPKDSTTPDASSALLAALAKGTLLSASSTALMLDMMSRVPHAGDRIGGALAKGDLVAYHKAGGAGGVTNDVALVSATGGERFAISVFLKGSVQPVTARDKAMAKVAADAISALRNAHPGCPASQ